MKQLKGYAIVGILFVLIAGSLAHFLYEWSGSNPVVGLFTPVNESIWEHMKLLFFPMLLYSAVAAIRFKADKPCIAYSFCFGNLIGTFLIPVFYYAYTAILNRDFFVLDLFTFVISTATAFYIAYQLTLSCKLKPYAVLIYALTAILFLCFLFFTYHPPMLKLFDDPSVHALSRQPYFVS